MEKTFSLQPGSIIQFKRSYYSHYGVYYKRNKVIHFDGTIQEKQGSSVILSNLYDISGEPFIVTDKYYNLEPIQSCDFIERCNDVLGTEDYNILWNNCEHMATYIRYGKKVSRQVKQFYLNFSIISFTILLTSEILKL